MIYTYFVEDFRNYRGNKSTFPANKMTKYSSEATTLKSETNSQSATFLMTLHVMTFTTSAADRFARDLTRKEFRSFKQRMTKL